MRFKPLGAARWKSSWRRSDDVYEYDYARLIHVGISNSVTTPIFSVPVPKEERARWKAEVAEPWWQAMRRRAEQDGLRINCFLGADQVLATMRSEALIAAACLTSPNGSVYAKSWEPSGEVMEALLREWGETLIAARGRHPYAFAFQEEPS